VTTGEKTSGEKTFEARARYLHREHTLIEFGDSLLVTDHPLAMGGLNKGPSPGEVLLAALTTSTVLAVRRAFADSDAPSVTARARFQGRQQRADGPMSTYTYLARMPRRIEVAGDVTDAELARIAAAASSCPVAVALSSGMEIDERVVVLPPIGGRVVAPPPNEEMLDREREWSSFERGHLIQDPRVQGTASPWLVSALALDRRRALVDLSHQSLLFGEATASRSPGTTPTDTLLGSLAACTAIFVGRWAGLKAIPIETAEVVVRATVSLDAEGNHGPITAIEKITEVRSELSPEQFEILDFVAGNCVLGETFKHGTEIVDEIIVTRAERTGTLDLSRLQTAPPVDATDCDDDTCCVVDPAVVDAALAARQSSE
jgi:uncharacterized OsmC-like protein